MLFHKIVSTGLGIGYIGKGAGTIAAVFTCLIWYFFQSGYFNDYYFSAFFTLIITGLGIWSADQVEQLWGKDSNKVVIDEVAGMCITLLFIPISIKVIIIGLILFRFFDIVKPFFIRKMESLKGGWGVMADDVLAGIYANIVLQAIVFFNLL